MTTTTMNANSWKLWLIGILFVLPSILALIFYQMAPNWIKAKKNHGQLLLPPVQLSQLRTDTGLEINADAYWQGKWNILYVPDADCKKNCISRIEKLYKIRLALNKEFSRTHQVLVSQQAIEGNNPAISSVWVVSSQGFKSIRQKLSLKPGSSGIFIMDPNGNIMMKYQTKVLPKAIYEDMGVLLKASRIG